MLNRDPDLLGEVLAFRRANRFEVNGTDAALSFIKGKDLSNRRVQLIWDIVALNSTPSLAFHKEWRRGAW
jgi:hypothetical protein